MRVKTRHQEMSQSNYKQPPSFILLDDSTLARDELGREEPPVKDDNADNMEWRAYSTVFDRDEVHTGISRYWGLWSTYGGRLFSAKYEAYDGRNHFLQSLSEEPPPGERGSASGQNEDANIQRKNEERPSGLKNRVSRGMILCEINKCKHKVELNWNAWFNGISGNEPRFIHTHQNF